MEKVENLPRFVIVKKQTVKDDKKYYGLYLVDRMLKRYIRILTFKNDLRGYALLDATSCYIGDNAISDYYNKRVEGEL